MAIGCDIGTSNLLVAKKAGPDVEVKRLRNAFVEINDEQKQHLASSSLSAVEIKGKSYIVGDEAVAMARILSRPLRRPMASGILNPTEVDARAVVGALVKALVGEPQQPDELCAFSVPAVALDLPGGNTVWHTGFFTQLLEQLGYQAEPVNEALAIIYSDCAAEDHCGIAISHGAGQVNVAASYKLLGNLQFSIARSGDWIDRNTSAALGVSVADVLKVKEDPHFDLMDAEETFDELGLALTFHYRAMIKYEIGHLLEQWRSMKGQLNFPEPVPIVLSGGTAAIKGFLELWCQQFDSMKKKMPVPFKIKEIRMAQDPFGAVARGLLHYALAKA
jgi:hypothetical protein